jgi:DNA (cytosine-5)-methyltransferase 1
VADASQLQCNDSKHNEKNSAKDNGQPRGASCEDFMADADHQGLQGRAETRSLRGQRTGGNEQPERCVDLPRAAWLPEPNVGRVAHGVPRRVDRLKALGNAVVPQIPEMIGYAILESYNDRRPT